MIKGVVLNSGSHSTTVWESLSHVDYLSPNLCNGSSEKTIGVVEGEGRERRGRGRGEKGGEHLPTLLHGLCLTNHSDTCLNCLFTEPWSPCWFRKLPLVI